MMLKQATPSRSQKTRGFKVKRALKICLLLAISIWLLYQVKQRSSEKIRRENPVIKFGRKDLNPVLRNHDFESSKKVEKEEETDIDDAKVEEINATEGRGGGDDEIDGNDQERAEDEEEDEEDSDSESEDLIDDEDREKEEATVVEEETVESSQMKEESADDDVSTRDEEEIGSTNIGEKRPDW